MTFSKITCMVFFPQKTSPAVTVWGGKFLSKQSCAKVQMGVVSSAPKGE